MSESTFSDPFVPSRPEARTQSTAPTRPSPATKVVRSRSVAAGITGTARDDQRYVRPNDASTVGSLGSESETQSTTYDLRAAWFRYCQSVAQDFPRIGVDLRLMGGRPTIRGTTISVSQIQDLAAAGYDAARISDEFEHRISLEDVQESFRFASRLVALE